VIQSVIHPATPAPVRFTRQANRDAVLIRSLVARVGEPHAWGRTDCWSLAVSALSILSGRSTAEITRGLPRYQTRASAIRAARAQGGIGAVLARWGLLAVPRTHEQVGDLVVTSGVGLDAACVVLGPGRYLGVVESHRVGWVSPPAAARAYRVAPHGVTCG
jgi:hypothetical protein